LKAWRNIKPKYKNSLEGPTENRLAVMDRLHLERDLPLPREKPGPKPLYGERMRKYLTVPVPDEVDFQLNAIVAKLNQDNPPGAHKRTKAELARIFIEDGAAFMEKQLWNDSST